MSDVPMKITVDTNVLLDAIDSRRNEQDRENAKRLLRLDDLGICHISCTTRLDCDVYRDPARQQILALPQIGQQRDGTAFRLDVSTLGSSDFLVDIRWAQDEGRLRQIVFPDSHKEGKKERARLSDLDHLLGHRASGNDLFVTRDKKILCAKVLLASEFGIKVMNPAEILTELSGG